MRKGFKPETIRALQDTYKILVKSKGTMSEKLERVTVLAAVHPEVQRIVEQPLVIGAHVEADRQCQ